MKVALVGLTILSFAFLLGDIQAAKPKNADDLINRLKELRTKCSGYIDKFEEGTPERTCLTRLYDDYCAEIRVVEEKYSIVKETQDTYEEDVIQFKIDHFHEEENKLKPFETKIAEQEKAAGSKAGNKAEAASKSNAKEGGEKAKDSGAKTKDSGAKTKDSGSKPKESGAKKQDDKKGKKK